MKGFQLQDLLDHFSTPSQFVTTSFGLTIEVFASNITSPITPSSITVVNHKFLDHKRQDQLRLLRMSIPNLPKMVGLTSSFQVWQCLCTYFSTKTHAKVEKIKMQLRTPKKDCTITTYLLNIKNLVDLLATIVSLYSRITHQRDLRWLVWGLR